MIKTVDNFEQLNTIISIDREKFNTLKLYVDYLLEYNKKINLISKTTIDDIWNRHILDSLQIDKLIINKNYKIADLGSGAGFPLVPLSILGYTNIELFEKSFRKCEFLEYIKTKLHCNFIIRHENLNFVCNRQYDIIVSRALANLNELLSFSINLSKDNTKLIFLKGKKIYEEIEEATKYWNFNYNLTKSITSEEGRIIEIDKLIKK